MFLNKIELIDKEEFGGYITYHLKSFVYRLGGEELYFKFKVITSCWENKREEVSDVITEGFEPAMSEYIVSLSDDRELHRMTTICDSAVELASLQFANDNNIDFMDFAEESGFIVTR